MIGIYGRPGAAEGERDWDGDKDSSPSQQNLEKWKIGIGGKWKGLLSSRSEGCVMGREGEEQKSGLHCPPGEHFLIVTKFTMSHNYIPLKAGSNWIPMFLNKSKQSFQFRSMLYWLTSWSTVTAQAATKRWRTAANLIIKQSIKNPTKFTLCRSVSRRGGGECCHA